MLLTWCRSCIYCLSFHSDDELRVTWDDNIAEFSLLPTSARGTTQTDAFTELQFWRSAFPRPFASREYVFAKRQWTDPLQRACFSVSKGVSEPRSLIHFSPACVNPTVAEVEPRRS